MKLEQKNIIFMWITVEQLYVERKQKVFHFLFLRKTLSS